MHILVHIYILFHDKNRAKITLFFSLPCKLKALQLLISVEISSIKKAPQKRGLPW
nr:MAG TPA: hypothetical protein [Caudoviricetes sp.]